VARTSILLGQSEDGKYMLYLPIADIKKGILASMLELQTVVELLGKFPLRSRTTLRALRKIKAAEERMKFMEEEEPTMDKIKKMFTQR
jgi:hypothetical protein